MRQPVHLRSVHVARQHPPYGLYVDPHAGRHAWLAVDARVVVALVSVIAGLTAALGTFAGAFSR